MDIFSKAEVYKITPTGRDIKQRTLFVGPVECIDTDNAPLTSSVYVVPPHGLPSPGIPIDRGIVIVENTMRRAFEIIVLTTSD